MSKELETLEKLLSFAFVMSENMVGLSKGNYDGNYFIKKTYEYLHKYNVDLDSKLELKKALTRLEQIDNAKQDKVWECFDALVQQNELSKRNGIRKEFRYDDELEVIEQSLINAQENNKILDILKANIVDTNIKFGTSFDSENKISLTIEVYQPKDYTDKITGDKHCVLFKNNNLDLILSWLKDKSE